MKSKLKRQICEIHIVRSLYRLIIRYYNRLIKDHKFYRIRINPNVKIEMISDDESAQTFGGYYNLSPFNANEDIIFSSTSTTKIRGSSYEALKILFKSRDYVKYIDETYAWNWQQGSLLQWFGESNNKIIYNKYSCENKKFYSIIRNINSDFKKQIDYPIYAVSKKGNFALTLNFNRIAKIKPDYGYFYEDQRFSDLKNFDDGIWNINLINNNCSLIISLD